MSSVSPNWSFQEKAVGSALSELENFDRAQIIMACGTGKSTVQAKIAKAKLGELAASGEQRPVITVYVPNLGLVRQMEHSFKDILGDDVDYLGIGSNKDRKKDIPEDAMHMSTNPVDIRQTILNRTKPLVVFSTYQSSLTLSEALIDEKGQPIEVALGFMDEAHRTAGYKNEGSPFSYVLHDENVKIGKRLFFTATPTTYEELEDGSETKVSMDDTELYGRVAYSYSYSQALKDGVVSPLRVKVPVITAEEIKEYRELRQLDATDVDDKMIIAELALRMVMKETDQSRVMTFHQTVEKAQFFANRMEATHGPDGFNVFHINGDSTPAQRQVAFDTLSNSPTILTGVRATGEGANANGLEIVMFVDGRQSTVEVVQNIGRLQRRDPENPGKIGSIICPIIIDETSQVPIEDQIANSEYRTIFRVVEGLRASSDLASISVKKASRLFGQTGEITPLSNELGIQLVGASKLSEGKLRQLENGLRIHTFNNSADIFYMNIGMLERYISETGRMPHADSDLGTFLTSATEKSLVGALNKEEMALIAHVHALEDGLQRNSFNYNIDRLHQIQHELDMGKEVDLVSQPHLKAWADDMAVRYNGNDLTPEERSDLEEITFSLWNQRAADERLRREEVRQFIESASDAMSFMVQTGVVPDFERSPVQDKHAEFIHEAEKKLADDRLTPSQATAVQALHQIRDVLHQNGEVNNIARMQGISKAGLAVSDLDNESLPGLKAWIADRVSEYNHPDTTPERKEQLHALPGGLRYWNPAAAEIERAKLSAEVQADQTRRLRLAEQQRQDAILAAEASYTPATTARQQPPASAATAAEPDSDVVAKLKAVETYGKRPILANTTYDAKRIVPPADLQKSVMQYVKDTEQMPPRGSHGDQYVQTLAMLSRYKRLSPQEKEWSAELQRVTGHLQHKSFPYNLQRLQFIAEARKAGMNYSMYEYPGLAGYLRGIQRQYDEKSLPFPQFKALSSIDMSVWHPSQKDALRKQAQEKVQGAKKVLASDRPVNDTGLAMIDLREIKSPKPIQLSDPQYGDVYSVIGATQASILAELQSQSKFLDSLKKFVDENGKNPSLRTDSRSEAKLAVGLLEVEEAYLNSYLAEPRSYDDKDDKSFSRLSYTQRAIASSKFMFGHDHPEAKKSINLTGKFTQPEPGRYVFVPLPAADKTGISVPGSHVKLPTIKFEMHLTEAQRDQVDAMGSNHTVTIDIGRAGKNPMPHKDGELRGIVHAIVDRQEITAHDYLRARAADHAVISSTPYSQRDITHRAHAAEDPVTDLRENGKHKVNVQDYVSMMNLIGKSFGTIMESDEAIRYLKAPGVALYDAHEPLSPDERATTIKQTLARVINEAGGSVLTDATIRERNIGIGNTLQAIDATLVAVATARANGAEKTKTHAYDAAMDELQTTHPREVTAYRRHIESIRAKNQVAAKAKQNHRDHGTLNARENVLSATQVKPSTTDAQARRVARNNRAQEK